MVTEKSLVVQWIPLNRDRFLQPKKSRLTENPLYPKLFMYCYLVNGYSIYIPINRKSPLSKSRLTEIHCTLLPSYRWLSLGSTCISCMCDIKLPGCSIFDWGKLLQLGKPACSGHQCGVQESPSKYLNVNHLFTQCKILQKKCSSWNVKV